MFSFLSDKNTENNLCLLLLKEGRKESGEYNSIKLKGGWERKMPEFHRVIDTALHCNTQDPLSPVPRMCTQQKPKQARIYFDNQVYYKDCRLDKGRIVWHGEYLTMTQKSLISLGQF